MGAAEHYGIYGMWRHQGRLVLVRKSRGPYAGLLDLPGGSPEPGESIEQTLARELWEETGARLSGSSAPRAFDLHVTTDSSGRAIDLRHRGRILEVQVDGKPRLDIIDQDVHGAVLADGLTSDEVSPLVLDALRQFPSYRFVTLRENGAGTFDAEADAAYFPFVAHIGNGEAVENTVIERPDGAIVLDFDADGHLMGVEIVGAKALLRGSTISGLEQIG